ncbi:uncharacterized protein RHO17_016419 isoform 2-T2 [Thomomys bottae]
MVNTASDSAWFFSSPVIGGGLGLRHLPSRSAPRGTTGWPCVSLPVPVLLPWRGATEFLFPSAGRKTLLEPCRADTRPQMKAASFHVSSTVMAASQDVKASEWIPVANRVLCCEVIIAMTPSLWSYVWKRAQDKRGS